MEKVLVSGKSYVLYFILLVFLLLFLAGAAFCGYTFVRYNRYRSSAIRCADFANKRFDILLDFYAPENVTYSSQPTNNGIQQVLNPFTFVGDQCTNKKIPAQSPYNPVLDKIFDIQRQTQSCGLSGDPNPDQPWIPQPITIDNVTSTAFATNTPYCKPAVTPYSSQPTTQ